MSRHPDPRANGLSTNEYCALLPRRRHSYAARGRILLLPGSALVVVPFEELKGGGWYAAVVEGHSSYPVGGYHIHVSEVEAETAIELAAGDPVPTTIITTCEEAEALDECDYILTRAHNGLRKTIVDGETRWTAGFLTKVSLRTEELADHLPAAVVPATKEISRV